MLRFLFANSRIQLVLELDLDRLSHIRQRRMFLSHFHDQATDPSTVMPIVQATLSDLMTNLFRTRHLLTVETFTVPVLMTESILFKSPIGYILFFRIQYTLINNMFSDYVKC